MRILLFVSRASAVRARSFVLSRGCAPEAHCLCFSSQLCVASRSLCAGSTCDTHTHTWRLTSTHGSRKKLHFVAIFNLQFCSLKDSDLHMGGESCEHFSLRHTAQQARFPTCLFCLLARVRGWFKFVATVSCHVQEEVCNRRE